MTTMGPFLPYPPGEDEYRVAAADPGGEGAPAPAPGFGEVEGEPDIDIIDDTPEPGSVDPVPERAAAEILFRTPNPQEIGLVEYLAGALFWRGAVEEGVRPCVDVVRSAFDPAL